MYRSENNNNHKTQLAIKTVITFGLLVLSTLSFAQEEESAIATKEQTTQLREVEQTLSHRLSFVQEKEIFFLKEDVNSLAVTLTQVQTKSNKAQLKAALLEVNGRSDNSKKAYSITYCDGRRMRI